MIVVKVTVSVYEAGVKLNCIRLIMDQKEPYIVYTENKKKHNIEI